jgi:hypothetical protein
MSPFGPTKNVYYFNTVPFFYIIFVTFVKETLHVDSETNTYVFLIRKWLIAVDDIVKLLDFLIENIYVISYGTSFVKRLSISCH